MKLAKFLKKNWVIGYMTLTISLVVSITGWLSAIRTQRFERDQYTLESIPTLLMSLDSSLIKFKLDKPNHILRGVLLLFPSEIYAKPIIAYDYDKEIELLKVDSIINVYYQNSDLSVSFESQESVFIPVVAVMDVVINGKLKLILEDHFLIFNSKTENKNRTLKCSNWRYNSKLPISAEINLLEGDEDKDVRPIIKEARKYVDDKFRHIILNH